MPLLNRFRSVLLLLALLSLYLYQRGDIAVPQRSARSPTSLLPRAVADGISNPSASSVLARGSTYQVTYTSAYSLSYVNVDLYTVQSSERFVATVATAQSPSSTISITIPSSIAPGASYVLLVWGPRSDGTGNYMVPYSDHFTVVDPDAGVFNNPLLLGSIYTGRLQVLNYTLGSLFDGVTSVRIELINSAWPASYVVADNVPALGYSATYNYTWQVPASLKLSQRYSLRVSPSGGQRFPAGTYNPTMLSSNYLISSEFSIFPIPGMNDPAFTVSAGSLWITNMTYTVSWKYAVSSNSKIQLNGVVVEAYNVNLNNTAHYGYNIGTINTVGLSGSLDFKVPTTWPSGVYFVRVYGYPVGTSVSANVDPISGESSLFTVNDKSVTTVDISAVAVTSPKNWVKNQTATIAWTYSSQRPNTGFTIELYRLLTLYKLEAVLGVVNSTTFSFNYTAPSTLTIGSDYAIRVYASVDSEQQLGSWATAIAVYATASDVPGATHTRLSNGSIVAVGAISGALPVSASAWNLCFAMLLSLATMISLSL